MSLEFTSNGLVISTFDQNFEQLSQEYKNIYGQDINLLPDSPDGQRVGLETKLISDSEANFLSLYHSFDPDLASGERLYSILKICGVNPRAATRSQWDIEVTTDRDLTLEQGYTIEDEVGQLWFVPDAINLTQGTTTVTFRSRLFGAIDGIANSELSQSTVVLGVTDLNAPTNATKGQDEESELELKERRNKSVQLPSRSTIGSMFARLANTAGVTDLQIYRNETASNDPVLDLDAHSIWVVIEGGTQADIAEVMAKTKTDGTPMKGAISSTYVETIDRPNGGTFTINHVMKFDRPTITSPYVRVNARRKIASSPINTDLIEQAIADYQLNIGQDLVASELYDDAYLADGSFLLFDMEVSRDGVTYTKERIEADPDEKFLLDIANVDVTEVS